MGESSFGIVETYVRRLHELDLTTLDQHQTLMEKIKEGRQFDCMYQIWKYLDAKDRGMPWIKEPDPRSCRREIKTMIAGVKESLAKEGYEVLMP